MFQVTKPDGVEDYEDWATDTVDLLGNVAEVTIVFRTTSYNAKVMAVVVSACTPSGKSFPNQ